TAEIDNTFIMKHGYGEVGNYALITVSDTGTGMDELTVGRIFEPYFTTKEIGKGTGLGLSIAYGIVKQHKGYIKCQSEPDTGTSFSIYLPLVISNACGIEEIAQTRPEGGTETILVAEDEPVVRNLIKTVLESFGYTVIEAPDGEDAVTRFRENKADISLLLFDIVMPVKNGKAAYDEIRAMHPDIRAIFISGYAPDLIRNIGVFENDAEFISKPVRTNELLRKVREVLDR
ncbi:MAG: response regulator, partial [Nitrospirota bacterium]|nr:response regulator [Nitrospirota bacterium]